MDPHTITITMNRDIYSKFKDLYRQSNPTIERNGNTVDITYNLEMFSKIVDQFKRKHFKVISIDFLYDVEEQVDPEEVKWQKQHYDGLLKRNVITCINYNSISLIKLLSDDSDEWSIVALECNPKFWYEIHELYMKKNNNINIDFMDFFGRFNGFSNDERFEEYIMFMKIANLNFALIQQDSNRQYELENFLDCHVTRNNPKIIKHFLKTYEKQCKNGPVFLDFKYAIMRSIFYENFEISDLLIETYNKIKPTMLYIPKMYKTKIFIKNDGCVISIKSLQYFHSMLERIDIDWYCSQEHFIIDMIYELSRFRCLKPQFVYMVTAFPYEAKLVRIILNHSSRGKLIDKITLLE